MAWRGQGPDGGCHSPGHTHMPWPSGGPLAAGMSSVETQADTQNKDTMSQVLAI